MTLPKAFWERVEASGDCLMWTGPTQKDGSGVYRTGGKSIAAHRFAYELKHGPIPNGVTTRHTCGNRACVNPEHIEINDAETRFWRNVSCSESCWIWTGKTDRDGYGLLSVGGRYVRAHRFAYELEVGPIADGLYVCHACDNPSCVRPDHLHTGTPADNMQEMHQRGRAVIMRGEDHPNAKLTELQVRQILRLSASGEHTHEKLARRFGIGSKTIRDIVTGKTWKRVSRRMSDSEDTCEEEDAA